MQFKITFRVLQPGQLLPLSYQYELSAWIYKLISRSDSGFGQFLHQRGYTSKTKRFKLFTFSNLNLNLNHPLNLPHIISILMGPPKSDEKVKNKKHR